jgi:hypothetical protein
MERALASSSFTPPSPILSSLSTILRTSADLSRRPSAERSPFRIWRSLIRTWKRSTPRAARASFMTSATSRSALTAVVPTTSKSHW